MKLFNKPNWLKPEINELKYWIHLVILSAIVLFLSTHILGNRSFGIDTILYTVLFLAIGDIIAHTILGLD